MIIYPPGTQLAVMFPPDAGFNGACTTIRDLSRQRFFGFYSGGAKWLAVKLIMEHAFDCAASHGKGNRAYKREGLLSTMRDERLAQAMRERDRRLHADLYFDREVEARSYPQHESYPL